MGWVAFGAGVGFGALVAWIIATCLLSGVVTQAQELTRAIRAFPEVRATEQPDRAHVSLGRKLAERQRSPSMTLEARAARKLTERSSAV